MNGRGRRAVAIGVALLVVAAVAGAWALGRSGAKTEADSSGSSSTGQSGTHHSDRTRSSRKSKSKSHDYGTPQASPTVVGGASPAGSGASTSPAVTCPTKSTAVNNGTSLKAALSAAHPGSVIQLADGTYNGEFVASKSGTASQPIWLCGDSGAVLNGGSIRGGYVFHLQSASYWRLVGFSVTNGQKGVVVDGSTGTLIQGLTVTAIGDEGIHLRTATTHTVVLDNTISHTGERSKNFGEGIYVGSAKSNWCTYTKCLPDRSNYDAIIDNHISATSAESIDIKEGTQNGVIEGNSFNGAGGLTGADSWVDVKGNNWLIEGNSGQNSPVDGYQVHNLVPGWGTDNVFKNNSADVNGSGYGYHLAPIQNNVVYCNNKATNDPLGLTNTTCLKS